jgi:mono/diheme cytochrome c family protein
LFVGQVGLENGGPACHSCHSAGGHGNLGGSTLGPDLTDLAQRYGGTEAIAAALANPPSATMQPVFDGKALTDQERADLAAYLDSLTTRSEAAVDLLLIIGLAGAALLIGLMHLLSKRNRINYLQQLRSRT